MQFHTACINRLYRPDLLILLHIRIPLYPVLYLNLVTSLANVDPALHEAARNLGAGWYTRLRRITLPLIRPGIFAGGSIILIWSFTELGTPLMFGFTNVTPVQVFFGITELERNAMPLALTVVMLAGSSLLYIVGRLLLGRPGAASAVKGTLGASAERLAGGCRFLPLLLFGLVTFAAVLPHISLILLAFSGDWYNTVLRGDVNTITIGTTAAGNPLARALN